MAVEMIARLFFTMGAVLGALGVAAGAFGAHGLTRVLSAERVQLFQTAAHYQQVHSLALLAVGLAVMHWPAGARLLAISGWAFAAGVLLFSGSLYAYALLGSRWLALVTPFGGASFVFAWAAMAVAVWRA